MGERQGAACAHRTALCVSKLGRRVSSQWIAEGATGFLYSVLLTFALFCNVVRFIGILGLAASLSSRPGLCMSRAKKGPSRYLAALQLMLICSKKYFNTILSMFIRHKAHSPQQGKCAYNCSFRQASMPQI